MSTLEIARCAMTIEVTLVRRYGWVVRGVITAYSLPFRSAGERTHFLRLLAAYVGPAVPSSAVEDLAALLCLYHGSNKAAAQLAAHHLGRNDAAPLEEMDEMIGLLLDEASAADEAASMRQGSRS